MTPSTHLAVPANYWRLARSPRYSLTFAFPLLVAYEALALLLSRLEMVRVRNGADVLLKQLFVGLGGRYGLAVFGLILVGGGAALIGRDIRRSGGIRPRYFALMAAESCEVMEPALAGALASNVAPVIDCAGRAGSGRSVNVTLPALSTCL